MSISKDGPIGKFCSTGRGGCKEERAHLGGSSSTPLFWDISVELELCVIGLHPQLYRACLEEKEERYVVSEFATMCSTSKATHVDMKQICWHSVSCKAGREDPFPCWALQLKPQALLGSEEFALRIYPLLQVNASPNVIIICAITAI